MKLLKALCALSVLCGPCAALASEKSPEAEANVATEEEGEFNTEPAGAYIQMRSIVAPVVSKSDGRQVGSAAVTAVFQVAESNQIGDVCRYAPRIIDSMIRVLNAQPVVVDSRRRFDFSGIAESLKEQANKSLEKNLVTQVYLFSGTRAVDEGVLNKLPFTSVLGCRGANLDEGKGKQSGSGH